MTQISVDQAIEIALGHQRAGRHAEAENLYRQVLTVQPGNAEARYWLGILAATGGKTELGLQLVREAIAIRGPSAEWLYNLGVALQMTGKIDEAVSAYRESLKLKADFLPTLLNLGTLLSWRGEDVEAEGLFRRTVEVAPNGADGWTNLGNTLRRRRRLAEAARCHERAIALQPTSSTAFNNLGSVLKELGRTQEAVAMFRKATQLTPGDVRLWSNYLFSLFYDPSLNAADVFEEHRAWGERTESTVAKQVLALRDAGAPGRVLRVGYMSGDFRDHSVSFFFEGLLAAHDRRRVEVFCYADGMHRDAVSARIKRSAPHWRDVGTLNDEQLAAMIRADGIDVLVDLAGHTAGNRMGVFARRAAPVQVSYLGYLGTTGLRAMDYRLTDAVADPPLRTERFYTETLFRLPKAFACYRPPADAPPVASAPFEKSGHVTFGSFNMLSKVNAETFGTWGSILRKCPGSRLLMVAGGLEEHETRAWVHAGFAGAGIGAERIELIGALDFQSYLAVHARVDIVLDTFPVVGHTVTCHALWMGVPVVTRAGSSYAGRLGASVMTAVGLEDLIAETEAGYIDAAVALGQDPSRLRELREGMRERVRHSPVMDERGVAGAVEEAFLQMWKSAGERGQPAGERIDVQQTLAAAIAHHQANRVVEAERLYRQVLAVEPANADGLHLLGVIAVQAGNYSAGAALIRQAAAISPQSAAVHYNLGCALQGTGEREEAKASFQRAIELLPSYVEAWNNLGDVHRDQRNYPEAERCFRQAIAYRPDFADAWTNLGTVFNRTARQEEALAAHRRALELRPDFAVAHNNLGHALMDVGEVGAAMASFEHAAALAPQSSAIQSNRLLTAFYDPSRDADAHTQQHREWARKIMPGTPCLAHVVADSATARPLRVGYVSADFYDHSVSVFFEPLLAAHHVDAVETFCYATAPAGDAVTQRLCTSAKHWRDISALSDDSAATQILSDRIDILVDLSGHTAGNRIALFARRLAPVQVAYLGYLGTTGLPTIDFRLTDAVADPPGQSVHHHTETLWRLPTLACYRAPADAPAVGAPPFTRNGYVTFGCTNMLYKISPQLLRSWAVILRRIPGARLRMMSKGLESAMARERLEKLLGAEGIDLERINFVGKQPFSTYLATHSEIDVMLDTYPVNGHTVTCHALWMGVPVVTLAGKSYAERLGASVLATIGMPELIAPSAEAYADIAVALGEDGARLGTMRSILRPRMRDSRLMDESRFATDVETAYHAMLAAKASATQ